jgi:hypothetical protein
VCQYLGPREERARGWLVLFDFCFACSPCCLAVDGVDQREFQNDERTRRRTTTTTNVSRSRARRGCDAFFFFLLSLKKAQRTRALAAHSTIIQNQQKRN